MFYLVFLLYITIFFECTSAQDDRIFCPHVLQMYQHCTSNSQTTNTATRVVSVRTGKAGPRGMPGKNSSVDYDLINVKITEEIRKRTNEIVANRDRKILQLQNGIRSLETQVSTLLNWYRAKNGMFYKIFKTKVDYATAKRRCIEQGALLVSKGIRQPEVFRELQDLTKIAASTTWIGLDDIVREGTWTWSDGSDDTEHIPWRSAEPSNSGGKEDCALIWDFGTQYLLNDAPCNEPFMYMCEKNYQKE